MVVLYGIPVLGNVSNGADYISSHILRPGMRRYQLHKYAASTDILYVYAAV